MKIRISDAPQEDIDATVDLLCAVATVHSVSPPKQMRDGGVARYLVLSPGLTAHDIEEIMRVADG